MSWRIWGGVEGIEIGLEGKDVAGGAGQLRNGLYWLVHVMIY